MEGNHSSGLVRIAVSHYFQAVHSLTSFIPLLIDLSFMADPHFQPGGQSVYYRSSHSVKSSGHLVSAAAEFSSCVKDSKDHFHRRDPCFMVDSYRNSSSVICDCN